MRFPPEPTTSICSADPANSLLLFLKKLRILLSKRHIIQRRVQTNMDQTSLEFQKFSREMSELLELITLYQGISRYYQSSIPLFPAEVHLMLHIEEGITSITELANHEKKTKSAISQIVTRIHKKGLVEKCPGEASRREIVLKLTEEGKKITRYHKDIDRQMFAEIWEQMGSVPEKQRLDSTSLLIRALRECYEARF